MQNSYWRNYCDSARLVNPEMSHMQYSLGSPDSTVVQSDKEQIYGAWFS